MVKRKSALNKIIIKFHESYPEIELENINNVVSPLNLNNYIQDSLGIAYNLFIYICFPIVILINCF